MPGSTTSESSSETESDEEDDEEDRDGAEVYADEFEDPEPDPTAGAAGAAPPLPAVPPSPSSSSASPYSSSFSSPSSTPRPEVHSPAVPLPLPSLPTPDPGPTHQTPRTPSSRGESPHPVPRRPSPQTTSSGTRTPSLASSRTSSSPPSPIPSAAAATPPADDPVPPLPSPQGVPNPAAVPVDVHTALSPPPPQVVVHAIPSAAGSVTIPPPSDGEEEEFYDSDHELESPPDNSDFGALTDGPTRAESEVDDLPPPPSLVDNLDPLEAEPTHLIADPQPSASPNAAVPADVIGKVPSVHLSEQPDTSDHQAPPEALSSVLATTPTDLPSDALTAAADFPPDVVAGPNLAADPSTSQPSRSTSSSSRTTDPDVAPLAPHAAPPPSAPSEEPPAAEPVPRPSADGPILADADGSILADADGSIPAGADEPTPNIPQQPVYTVLVGTLPPALANSSQPAPDTLAPSQSSDCPVTNKDPARGPEATVPGSEDLRSKETEGPADDVAHNVSARPAATDERSGEANILSTANTLIKACEDPTLPLATDDPRRHTEGFEVEGRPGPVVANAPATDVLVSPPAPVVPFEEPRHPQRAVPNRPPPDGPPAPGPYELRVTLVQARNVGLSPAGPFVVRLSVGDHSACSKPARCFHGQRTVNWNEEFCFPVADPISQTLRLTLEAVSTPTSDFGRCQVPLHTLGAHHLYTAVVEPMLWDPDSQHWVHPRPVTTVTLLLCVDPPDAAGRRPPDTHVDRFLAVERTHLEAAVRALKGRIEDPTTTIREKQALLEAAVSLTDRLEGSEHPHDNDGCSPLHDRGGLSRIAASTSRTLPLGLRPSTSPSHPTRSLSQKGARQRGGHKDIQVAVHLAEIDVSCVTASTAVLHWGAPPPPAPGSQWAYRVQLCERIRGTHRTVARVYRRKVMLTGLHPGTAYHAAILATPEPWCPLRKHPGSTAAAPEPTPVVLPDCGVTFATKLGTDSSEDLRRAVERGRIQRRRHWLPSHLTAALPFPYAGTL